MPTVPRYDLPQEQLGALPTVRQRGAPAGAFEGSSRQTGAMGSALTDAGNATLDVATDLQRRENADLVFRADAALTNDYLTFERSARERRGQQAWNLTQDAAKWWEENTKKQSEGLTNSVQRQAFEQQSAQRRLRSLDTLSAHESSERRASLQESAQASIVGAINLAAGSALQWRSPDAPAAPAVGPDGLKAPSGPTPVSRDPVTAAKMDVLKRVQILSDLNGWTPELRAAKEAEYVTNFHKQVLGALVDVDPAKAKAYYQANEQEVEGSQRAEVQRALSIGGAKVVAQSAADEVMASGLGEAEALKLVRDKFQGDEESQVVAEVKVRFSERGQARESDQRDAADQAYDVFARTGRLSSVPTSVLSRMDGKTLMALRKDAKSAAAGEEVSTDWSIYYDLRKRIADDPARFTREVDLRQYFPQLGKAQRESLIDLQTKASKPDELGDVVSFERQLTNTHNALGWTGQSSAAQKGQFDEVASRAVAAAQIRAGKKLTQTERQEVLDRLVIEGSIADSGTFFDDKGRLYEFVDTEQMTRFEPQVPKGEREKIAAALTRAGKPVTDAEVLRLYKRQKGLP